MEHMMFGRSGHLRRSVHAGVRMRVRRDVVRLVGMWLHREIRSSHQRVHDAAQSTPLLCCHGRLRRCRRAGCWSGGYRGHACLSGGRWRWKRLERRGSRLRYHTGRLLLLWMLLLLLLLLLLQSGLLLRPAPRLLQLGGEESYSPARFALDSVKDPNHLLLLFSHHEALGRDGKRPDGDGDNASKDGGQQLWRRPSATEFLTCPWNGLRCHRCDVHASAAAVAYPRRPSL